MNQSPADEFAFWENAGPEDHHGVPPYDLEPVVERLHEAAPYARYCLDIGCGDGRLTNTYAVRHPDAQVWGFDLAGPPLTRAMKVAPINAFYRLHDLRSLPQIGYQADLVWAITVFQHVFHVDVGRCIEQVAEMLRYGGMFVFTLAVNDGPDAPFNHPYSADEFWNFKMNLLTLFTDVRSEHDDDTDWTWVTCRR